jgi:hypothetical protein
MSRYYALFLIVCLGLLIVVVELLRRKQLREKYAILWLVIIIVLPVVFFNEHLIEKISLMVGILYPPTLVFIAAILGLLLLVLMLSVIDSHQTDRIIKLTQKVALLEERLNSLLKTKK